MLRRGFLGLGTAIVLGGLVWAVVSAQAPRSGARLEQDVIFAEAGGQTLRLDLALPATGKAPHPAIIILHGGGWVGGSRKQLSQTIEVLALRGYVVAAPDYRLAPTHRWPACIEDCKAAVRWMRAHAGKYAIDPDRIAAVGLSAGGHLACLLGVTERGDGLEGSGGYAEHSSKVQAVVSFSAPTDLTAEALCSEEVVKRNLEPLFGGTLREKPDAYRKASPLLYQPRTPPAFFLFHGTADTVVPHSQATAFAEKIRTAGGSAQVSLVEGKGHTWAGPSLRESIDRMLIFLDETLKK